MRIQRIGPKLINPCGSARLIANALPNLDVLTKLVCPMSDYDSATPIVLAVMAVRAVRADIHAAGTDAKLHSVCRRYCSCTAAKSSHGWCDHRSGAVGSLFPADTHRLAALGTMDMPLDLRDALAFPRGEDHALDHNNRRRNCTEQPR